MDSLEITSAIILLVASVADILVVFSRDLMMLQQNSYRNDRYTKWFNQSGESTNIGRIFCCIGLLLMLVNHLPFFAGASVATIITIWQFFSLKLKKYKKPLVWTNRAKRIYTTMLLLTAVITVVAGLFVNLTGGCYVLMSLLILSPILLLISNIILIPVEKRINRKYYNEAKAILASMPDLKIIGITGSYGKTSTKHYLNRILQEHFSTMMTPGSFNTTMGVIRTIREYLKPYNEVFIVEMGAKQIGDIKEICDLVKPHIGIVTAVGEQHLESFKNIENVQRTKFELVDSLPETGLAVVNNDFQFIANRAVANVECLRYGIDTHKQADFIATDIIYTADGTMFTIKGESLQSPITLQTRLVGECNISNLIAAVIVAIRLGVPEDKIRYAVEQIEQVEHRLNVKRTPGGVTIIDDAFNSNPAGSKMALNVLSRMTEGRRIVITPGMIELGERQYAANAEFGKHIADCADIAIIVGHYNRDAILNGMRSANFKEDNIYPIDTFKEAQALLMQIARKGDTVLYENDLPDTFK